MQRERDREGDRETERERDFFLHVLIPINPFVPNAPFLYRQENIRKP